jgi:hypothetical protein
MWSASDFNGVDGWTEKDIPEGHIDQINSFYSISIISHIEHIDRSTGSEGVNAKGKRKKEGKRKRDVGM